ncbi:MAG: hypothetical protein ACKV2V_18990 [Blastocatellia bacterium]
MERRFQKMRAHALSSLSRYLPVSWMLLIAWGALLGMREQVSIPASVIQPEKGHAFVAQVPGSRYRLPLRGDDAIDSKRSTLELYENGRRFEVPHSGHDDIREKGLGVYSHWGNYLYFSTSDNSDPRTNGRVYNGVVTYYLPFPLAVLLLAPVYLFRRRRQIVETVRQALRHGAEHSRRARGVWLTLAACLSVSAYNRLTVPSFLEHQLGTEFTSAQRASVTLVFALAAIALIWLALSRAVFPILIGVSRRALVLWLGGALLAGVFLYFVVPVESWPAGAGPWPLKPLGVAADLILLTAAVAGAGLWLARREIALHPEKHLRLDWLWFAMPALFFWTFWLLIFWPGIAGIDTTEQWEQIVSGRYDDFHPIFHSFTMAALLRLWHHPAAIAMAQIAAMALTAGAGLHALARRGVPRRILWITAILFAAAPPNFMTVINLWKDTLYSIAVLGLTVIVFAMLSRPRLARVPWWMWAALGVTAALAGLFRHNGVSVTWGTMALLALFRIREWRGIATAVLLILVLREGTRGPVYQAAGAPATQMTSVAPSLSVWVLAAHIRAGTPLAAADRAMVEKILPLPRWQYNRMSVMYTLNQKLNWNGVSPAELRELVIRLSLRAPWVTVQHFLDASRESWRLTHEPAESCPYFITALLEGRRSNTIPTPYAGMPGTWYRDNVNKTFTQSLIPGADRPFLRLLNRTFYHHSSAIEGDLLWHPALFLYLFCGALVIAAIRAARPRLLLAATPVLTHAVPMLLVTPASYFRYHYPAVVAGLLFTLPLLFVSPRPARPENSETATSPETIL